MLNKCWFFSKTIIGQLTSTYDEMHLDLDPRRVNDMIVQSNPILLTGCTCQSSNRKGSK